MGRPVSKVREAKLELYRKKGKIHAKAVAGRFNALRWGMVWLTQAIFYGLCWVNWESAGSVRQAVLFDIAHEKLYLFDLVLWPQDALLLAFVLIIAATALFLVTSLAGRLFCGFACPQTVYTSIFTWIEARVEGDHLARLKLDASPMSPRKLLIKTAKHGIWAIVAIWTAVTFVGYFTPIRELLPSVIQLDTGPWEAFWLIFYAAFTYVQAGLAREAVCQHMCPYSRFQGVMFDPETSNVAYDRQRGEPRSNRRQAGQTGDCIDCGICVQVCPTGIDIRDGLQYQCINCGLCIDACDQVMEKIGAPVGLIRFASENELASPGRHRPWYYRPRVGVYAALLLVFCGMGLWTLEQRSLLLVDVLRDRGALLRETSEGLIENAYTLKLMNLSEVPREFVVRIAGIPGAQIVGQERFTAEPGSIRPVSLTVAAPSGAGLSGIQPMDFLIEAVDDPAIKVVERSSFALP
ncbi:cytochrome c oxidase accessory protein CcoG [Ferribacterium limneticum]|uniref:cytochrome c oxidase accessory protein CcoG n=1 Tax=Ferribacterium limneticum TaxID=76259 RepID=UPI001CFBE1D9|nr:cytochrome c oxidase accessory protein CcoG [Ferribacterium limneticum]UCV27727.1 cytochrome c oxidase accessory protein CcoG [Ferribacterium limneticum]UCV31644.1 cytochrome c oxidase accessory protein CcoG [Ferribacterium limneticum]